MSVKQLLQIMASLPQFMEKVKKMGPEEKRSFVQALGLEAEEQDAAISILTAFQEGRPLSPQEQEVAQKLLEKGLKMNNLDMASVMQMLSGLK